MRYEPSMTLARFARAHCPRCRGTGKLARTGTVARGGVVLTTFAYEEECPWCAGAEMGDHDPMQRS